MRTEGLQARVLVWCVASAWAWPGTAWAQMAGGDPAVPGWRLALEQRVLQEDNPLRLPTAVPATDRVDITALDLDLTAAMGRHRASAWTRVEHVDYRALDALTHSAQRARGVWDWEAAGALSGRLWWRRQRDVPDGDLRLEPLTGRPHEQRIEQASALLMWGAQRRWGLQTQWQRDRVDESAFSLLARSFRQDTASVGAALRERGPWAATLGWRAVQGSLPAVPQMPAVPGAFRGLPEQARVDFSQHLWDAQASWTPRPGDTVSITASSGRGSRTPQPLAGQVLPAQPTQDQSLSSLHLDARWQPTGRLSLAAHLWRDEGQQAQVWTSLQDTASLSALGSSGSRVRRLSLQWDPVPHWRATVATQRTERRWRQSEALTVDGQALDLQAPWVLRDDTTRTSARVNWAVRPGLSLSCGVQRDHRRDAGSVGAAAQAAAAAQSYRARSVDCTLRWGMPAGRIGA